MSGERREGFTAVESDNTANANLGGQDALPVPSVYRLRGGVDYAGQAGGRVEFVIFR